MIRTKTVFILGAGASHPYNFPLGFKLKEEILTICNATTKYTKIFEALGQNAVDVSNFANTFRESGRITIDEFLNNRRDFLNIGKILIAMALLPKEHKSFLFGLPHDEDWYGFVLGKMYDSLKNFRENNVSFITFNYDRSLEHYLFTALKNRTDTNDDKAAFLVSTIPIVHIHGQLGYLPWQLHAVESLEQNDIVDYIAPNHPDLIKAATNHIRVIFESDSDTVVEKAQQLLLNADQVFILGFGYHPSNVSKIFISPTYSSQVRMGTVYGFEEEEIKMIIKESGGWIKGRSFLIPEKIMPFFRKHIVHRLK